MIVSSPVTESQARMDFWKFWFGQTISALGSSLNSFALPLLIFRLTGSSVHLALTLTAITFPYLLLGLVIGAWADRVDRKRFMIMADIARALVITSIPLAAWLGILSVWWIYAVAFLQSTLSICFDAANFAAIPSLVRQEHLVTANGRIQAGYSTASVTGPLLGGLLLTIIPLPLLFFITTTSFLLSASFLYRIRASFQGDPGERKSSTSLRDDVVEGLHYVLKHPLLSWITLLLLLINFILPTSSTQLVLFARQWFSASEFQIGLLYAGGSLGTLVFSLTAKHFQKKWSHGAIALGSLMLVGGFIALTALTRWYWLLLLLWVLRGGADVLFLIHAYSLTQSNVPRRLLGRVITVTRVLTWSTASLGALLGGFAIAQTGQVALVYAAVGLLVAGVAFLFFFTPLGQSRVEKPDQE